MKMKTSFIRKSYGSHAGFLKTTLTNRQEGVISQAVCFLLFFIRWDPFLQKTVLFILLEAFTNNILLNQASTFQVSRQMSFVFSPAIKTFFLKVSWCFLSHLVVEFIERSWSSYYVFRTTYKEYNHYACAHEGERRYLTNEEYIAVCHH